MIGHRACLARGGAARRVSWRSPPDEIYFGGSVLSGGGGGTEVVGMAAWYAIGGGCITISCFFISSNLCRPKVPRTPLIKASMMMMVRMLTPGGCVTMPYRTPTEYRESPATAKALDPPQVCQATIANKAASISDNGRIPIRLTPPTILTIAKRPVNPATTAAQPPAL
jgi:hypothetical protein